MCEVTKSIEATEGQVVKNDQGYINHLAKRAKSFDIPIDVRFNLTDNRYKNRRLVRDLVNDINDKYFKKSKEAGWETKINVDIHPIDRLSDREFPFEEFAQIVAKLATRNEDEILDLVEKKMEGVELPARINCYGHGAWMVGITITTHQKYDGSSKAFHVNVRTMYAERNMIGRERNVSVHRIWTRGMPKWLVEAQAKAAAEEGNNNVNVTTNPEPTEK